MLLRIVRYRHSAEQGAEWRYQSLFWNLFSSGGKVVFFVTVSRRANGGFSLAGEARIRTDGNKAHTWLTWRRQTKGQEMVTVTFVLCLRRRAWSDSRDFRLAPRAAPQIVVAIWALLAFSAPMTGTLPPKTAPVHFAIKG